MGEHRKEVRMSSVACVALPAAKICRNCKTVGEETAVERCPRCGRKRSMVPLLAVTTLEFLLGLAHGGDVQDSRLMEITDKARKAALEQTLLAVGGNYCAAAREVGVHRNTVLRILGPKGQKRGVVVRPYRAEVAA